MQSYWDKLILQGAAKNWDDLPEMDGHDFVPLLIRHPLKRIGTNNSCVCNEYVHATERVQRCLYDCVAVLSRDDRSDGLATRCPHNAQYSPGSPSRGIAYRW